MIVSRYRTLSTAAVALVVVAVAAWCALSPWSGFIDLAVYRMGGAGLGGGDLYDLALPGNGLPYTYPPFAAVAMVPLAHLPFDVAVALWSAAGVVALALVLARSLRASGFRPPAWVLPVLLVGALALEPVWSTFSFGQVNLLIMALVLLDLLPRPRGSVDDERRRRWQGVGVGVAAGIKLTPLIFIPYLVLTGRLRAAGVATAAFAATVAVGFAVDPGSARVFWTDAMLDPERVGGVAYAGNQSVMGFLTRVWGGEPPTLLWLGVAGTVAGLALLLGARLHRRGERTLGLCLAGMAMLLASPISWEHHWVWCVPTTVALVARATAGGSRRPGAAGVLGVLAWVAVFASLCIWWVPRRDDVELRWTLVESVPGNGYVIAAVVLLAALALRLLREERADEPASESDPARQPASDTASTDVRTSAAAGAAVVQGARST